MIRRGRLRTLTLWTGTALCVLIAAAFVVSAWWYIAAQVGSVGLDVSSGCIGIRLGDSYPYPPGFPPLPGFYRHPSFLLNWNSWGFGPRWVACPLYAVFAAVAIPTNLDWRFGPKPVKPGHCRCGYDLTGNTSGVCPECGVEVQT